MEPNEIIYTCTNTEAAAHLWLIWTWWMWVKLGRTLYHSVLLVVVSWSAVYCLGVCMHVCYVEQTIWMETYGMECCQYKKPFTDIHVSEARTRAGGAYACLFVLICNINFACYVCLCSCVCEWSRCNNFWCVFVYLSVCVLCECVLESQIQAMIPKTHISFICNYYYYYPLELQFLVHLFTIISLQQSVYIICYSHSFSLSILAHFIIGWS